MALINEAFFDNMEDKVDSLSVGSVMDKALEELKKLCAKLQAMEDKLSAEYVALKKYFDEKLASFVKLVQEKIDAVMVYKEEIEAYFDSLEEQIEKEIAKLVALIKIPTTLEEVITWITNQVAPYQTQYNNLISLQAQYATKLITITTKFTQILAELNEKMAYTCDLGDY